MFHLNRMLSVCFLAVTIVSATAAQEGANPIVQRTSVTITATAIGDRVRITAPASIVEMHVAVYAASGEKVFDQEVRGGNVFDWNLQDGQARRLAPGNYVCVVIAKSISGKISQKIGTVSVEEKAVSVQPAESPQLSAAQTQTIGPVEENSSWTVAAKDELQTPTVIAHDGTDGQMIRGRGALTFRIGNFFSGIDQEQMRLTEDGKLGIGTSEPKAKLDVAGTIRAQRFLIARPKLAGFDKSATDTMETDAVDSVQPLVAGTGTQDRIAKWTDNAGTLGDSGITEVGGNVGIGTTTPASKLVVSANSAPLPPASGIARFGDADGVQTAVFADAFGTNPIFNVRRANGTAAAPSAVQANQLLGVIGASGFGTSVYAGTRARVAFAASENWTNTANGSFITFNTTANGANTAGGSERLRIDNAGNVGIGTTAPAARLHVAGSSAAGTPIAILQSTLGGEVPLSFRSGATETARIRSDFLGRLFFAALNGASNDIFFRAGDDSPSGTNMFIKSSTGNVGINTTGPDSKLHVVTSLSGGTANPNSIATFEKAGDGYLQILTRGGDESGLIFGNNSGGVFYNVGSPGNNLQFRTNGNNTRMVVDFIGNVGIGTTSPNRKLHVVETSTGSVADPSAIAVFEKNGNGYLQLLTPDANESGLLFGQGGGGRGGVFFNNGATPFGLLFRTGGFNRESMVIDASGNVGIGTTNPLTNLDVRGDKGSGHVALIRNEAATDNAAVLRLDINGDILSNFLTTTNNFITFSHHNSLNLGAIQPTGSGGVELISGSADYAEWLPRLNPTEEIQPGEIVGLQGGRVTRKTRGASQVMAVSTGPIVSGNDPGEKARDGYEQIAFIGQVPVRVRGTVKSGDFIVASGLDDGTGIAVSPERITTEQFDQVVGQAWEASADPGVKSVRVAVGLIRHDPAVGRLVEYSRKQTARIAALEARLTAFEARLESQTTKRNLKANHRRKSNDRSRRN